MNESIEIKENIENIESQPIIKDKWYALYVPTSREEYAKNYIQTLLPNTEVFIPKVAVQRRVKGEIQTNIVPLFAGYIFIISKDSKVLENLIEVAKSTDKIYKVLKYSDSVGCELFPSDVEILTSFLDKEKVMQKSEGIIIGDKIIIKRGPLVGKESTIKKINRHKMIATVEIEMMGRVCEMKVPLEIVEKKI